MGLLSLSHPPAFLPVYRCLSLVLTTRATSQRGAKLKPGLAWAAARLRTFFPATSPTKNDSAWPRQSANGLELGVTEGVGSTASQSVWELKERITTPDRRGHRDWKETLGCCAVRSGAAALDGPREFVFATLQVDHDSMLNTT